MPSENQTQPNPGQDSQDCEVASHARQARGSRVIQRRTASHLLRCEQPGSFSSASWRDRNQSLPVDGDLYVDLYVSPTDINRQYVLCSLRWQRRRFSRFGLRVHSADQMSLAEFSKTVLLVHSS